MILDHKGKLLGKPKTGGYRQINFDSFTQYRDLPVFSFRMIRHMLLDPTIRLGLAMRSAPLTQAEFAYKDNQEWVPGLRAETEEVGQFVLKQLRRFWLHELGKMLTAQVWGWSAGEVTYRLKDGKVELDRTLHRKAQDVFAVNRDGELAGVKFTRIGTKGTIRLPFPKCYWHTFGSESESPYGMSVLQGAYSSWADKQLEGGACDVRRLFMHKDAYGGIDMSYPPGVTPSDTGADIPNRDIAREIAEQAKAGSITTRPSQLDPTTGQNLWTIERATVPSNPVHILQYPKDLDLEMIRGMEIPDEVVLSQMTGAWQGKQVPMLTFFTGLDCWLNNIVKIIVEQILEPLVLLNFGPKGFEVTTKPLAEQAMEQMGEGEQEAMPPQMQQQQPAQQPQQLALKDDATTAELMVGRGIADASELVKAGRKFLNNGGLKRPKRMAVAHAPKGGVSIGGTNYKGGEFIPGVSQAEVDKAAKEGGGKQEDKAAAKGKASDSKQSKFEESLKTKTPSDAKAFRMAKADSVAIPPAWTDVTYHGKGKDIIAEGRDSKGRRQRIEDAGFRQRQILAKHQRIQAGVASRMDTLRNKLRVDAATSEEAKVLYLITQTGFRIGGAGDGKAAKPAFGASTLQGQHVTVEGDTVTFDFPGKKGVRQNHTIEDPVIASMFADIEDGKAIFKTNDRKVRAKWKNYGGKKVHDIRNVVATETAASAIADLIPPKPTSVAKFNALQKQVATVTALKLGNRPSESLKTYINPAVFDEVRVA